MGPSGAGVSNYLHYPARKSPTILIAFREFLCLQKTTLLSALTLDAFYGKPTGNVTLNGVKLTDSVFKRHCYVMKQHDKHWPYLTCRETLIYAAELYNVAARQDIPDIVEEIITKMGLGGAVDTRCARLSGGEQRRLSIGIALLKQVRFLVFGTTNASCAERWLTTSLNAANRALLR
jgi:ABC-type Na+ transport system ATPase subunit NatA